jgi:carboxymethylenebutenolidase
MTDARRLGVLSTGYPRMLPPAPTAISTPAEGLVEGAVWVPVADGELPAYRAAPGARGPHPILLVVQEVFGVDEYLKDTCRRAAHAGYVAIAPELFARQGRAGECTSREELFALVGAAPDAQALSDLDACAEFAARSCGGDGARLGITGFCWGGRTTWLYAAHNPRLRAGVAWYGRLVGDTDERHPRHPLDVAARLHAPVLGLYGSEDQGIPLDTVERMRKALEAAGSKSRFVVYDGAPHAFHADYRPSYQAGNAKDGWSRMLAWLREHGAA